MNKLAQGGEIQLGPDGGFRGFGTLGLQGSTSAPEIFNKFIQSIVGIMTVVAAIWFIFLIIAGAVGIMTAGPDKQKVQQASTRITNGVIGLFIIIAAVAIIEFFGTLFGFENILNPAKLINTIGVGGN